MLHRHSSVKSSCNASMGDKKVRMRKKHSELLRGSVSHTGNGIGGLVVFGGALAVAGFIAITRFLNKKNKNTNSSITPKPEPQQLSSEIAFKSQEDHEIETIKALNSLPQVQESSNDADAARDGTSNTTSFGQINPSDLLSLQTIITEEEKIDSVVSESPNCSEAQIKEILLKVLLPTHNQEIVLLDDYSHPESAASSIEEECLASLFDSSDAIEQNAESQSQPSLKSIEKETEDNNVLVLENGEEKDSIIEAVMNSGVLSPEEHDFKEGEGKIDLKSEAERTPETDTDNDGGAATDGLFTVTPEATLDENEDFSLMQQKNDKPSVSQSHSFQTAALFVPMLLLLLLVLVLLFDHTQQQFFSFL